MDDNALIKKPERHWCCSLVPICRERSPPFKSLFVQDYCPQLIIYTPDLKSKNMKIGDCHVESTKH